MAVTANQLLEMTSFGTRVGYPVLATKHIYSGTLVYGVAASGFATDVIATDVNPFLGVAAEESDNTSGADGAKVVDCYTEGIFTLTGSGFTQATVGAKIYGVDNYTVSVTATAQPPIGRCTEYISSTRIRVKIDVQQMP